MRTRLLHFYSLLRMYVRLWAHHQISLRAAALSYALILALIPLLAVCLSGGSLIFPMRDLNTRFMGFLVQHLAPGSAAKISSLLTNFLAKVHFKAIGYVGFAVLLVTCLLLLSGIESSINRIWSIRKKKELWKRVVIYNLLLVLGPAAISFSLANVTLISHYFPNYVTKANAGAFLISTFLLAFVYKIFPNKRVHWTAAFVAGLFAAVAMELAKWGYADYTKKVLFYNQIYGGLALLPLFLLWMYVNWNIFLGGSLLSYMIQHRHTFRLAPNVKRVRND